LSVQSKNCSLQAVQAFAYSFLTICADEIYQSCLQDAANIISVMNHLYNYTIFPWVCTYCIITNQLPYAKDASACTVAASRCLYCIRPGGASTSNIWAKSSRRKTKTNLFGRPILRQVGILTHKHLPPPPPAPR
jgi:hypothetical protein